MVAVDLCGDNSEVGSNKVPSTEYQVAVVF